MEEVRETTPQSSSLKRNREDSKQCLICCSETLETQRGITPCNHNDVCGLCHLRLRFLHDDKRCPICKQVNDKIIVDADEFYNDDINDAAIIKDFDTYRMYGDSDLNDLGPSYILRRDCGMFFKKLVYEKHISSLFSYKCYHKKCADKRPFNSKKALETHLKTVHDQYLCDLCISNKRDFISKLPRLSQKELKEHQDIGLASIPGDVGHPTCKFCINKKGKNATTFRFYDITKLYDHLNKEHYKCHLCERQLIQDQFFDNYKTLERHFDNKHYLCKHPICLTARFVVFDNDICLRAHERSAHGVVSDNNTNGGSTKIQLAFNIRREGYDGSGYDNEEQNTPSNEDFNFSLAGQPTTAAITTISNPPAISNPLHAARTAQLISDAAKMRERQEEKERSESFPSLSNSNSNNNISNLVPSGWVGDNSNNNNTSNNVRKPPSVRGRVQPQDFPSLPSVKPSAQLLAARQQFSRNNNYTSTAKWSSSVPPARASSSSNATSTTTTTTINDFPSLTPFTSFNTAATYYAKKQASSAHAATATAIDDYPSLTPTASTANANYARKQQAKKKPSLDSANDFPSLLSKPKSKKKITSGLSKPKYQAATDYAKKMKANTAPPTTMPQPIIAPKKPPPQPTLQIAPQPTTNNFPSLASKIDNNNAINNLQNQQLLTLPEIKSILPTQTYKAIRTYLKQLSTNDISIQSFINQSKDLFTTSLYGDADIPLFWKVIPSVIQSCPEKSMRVDGMKYMETLKKREDMKKNTVYLRGSGGKSSNSVKKNQSKKTVWG